MLDLTFGKLDDYTQDECSFSFYTRLECSFIFYTRDECTFLQLISATGFTVVGVVCKFMTLLMNHMFWDKHSGESSLKTSEFKTTLKTSE